MRALILAACALLAIAPMPVAAEAVAVNGISLHYTVQGVGEPLLLLHGFGSCAANWSSMAAGLSTTYKVISVDARGHGQSTNPSGKFSHAQSAEDVIALMDALGIKRARALGFSSGGITLLHLATRHPDRLSKMVVVGAANYFPEGAQSILRSATMNNLPPEVLDEFRRCASRGEEQVRSLVDQFRALGFSRSDTDIKAAQLARITARTLIVHGDRDMFFPVNIPVGLYQSISDSALWIVPKGDHSPTAGAEEPVFLKYVRIFLEE